MKGARGREIDEMEAAAGPTAELAKDPPPGAVHRKTVDPDPTVANEFLFFFPSKFPYILSLFSISFSNSVAFLSFIGFFRLLASFVYYIRRTAE